MNPFKFVYVNLCECIILPYYKALANKHKGKFKLNRRVTQELASPYFISDCYKSVLYWWIYNYSSENLAKTILYYLLIDKSKKCSH